MIVSECAFSFIVPLFNHVDHSKAMLNSLLRTLPAGLDFEIILVDDGSVDGTKEWLYQLQNEHIRIVSNEKNLGYAKSNNRAAALAKGKILGLLNNDLIFLDGWLEPMMELINSTRISPGIVGNIQYRVDDNAIDHVGMQVSHLAKIEHIRVIPESSLAFKRTFAVTGACCLIFREDFFSAGGFDEQYINGGEDVDLCLKLSELGKYPYVSTISKVKHHVSLTRDRGSLTHEKNSRLIFSKWKPVLLQEIKNAWLQLLIK
ncbi:MAG: glycosyltransferase family 2 protein, partial [Burkholderiaceae bacterium]